MIHDRFHLIQNRSESAAEPYQSRYTTFSDRNGLSPTDKSRKYPGQMEAEPDVLDISFSRGLGSSTLQPLKFGFDNGQTLSEDDRTTGQIRIETVQTFGYLS